MNKIDAPFNSRPHKEVDKLDVFQNNWYRTFNSRPHKEVDQSLRTVLIRSCFFQLTTSQGGRLVPHFLVLAILTFQLTTSQGGRPYVFYLKKGVLDFFQLTTSQGGRLYRVVMTYTVILFQLTTSQGGRLYPNLHTETVWRLSTHDLTRRSTPFTLIKVSGTTLSTHDLTRRSTPCADGKFCHLRSFNSRPHKEVDVSIDSVCQSGYLSTHDLTRRSTLLRRV